MVVPLDPSPPETGKGVVLRLSLVPGEPLTGTVAALATEDVGGPEGPAAAFCGWLELMAAVNLARGIESS